jgi:hypothetical protein
MSNRRGCKATILAVAMVAGCETTTIRTAGTARVLTGIEMDQISAGSAVAVSNANASAVGLAPQTTTVTSTLASSGIPVSPQPYSNLLTLNYASARAVASAGAALFAQANGSTQIGVDGGGGGASIDAMSTATASRSASSDAQINMQFYGLSVGKVDLVFGTATATACCASSLGVQSTADGAGGGYWRQLQASPISDVSGQVQGGIDISVVSSALPILDAGQVSAFVAPTSSRAGNQ